MDKFFSGMLTAAIGVMMAVSTASAHHGWAGNNTEEFELTGVVESPVNLNGPHATMKVKADGKVWDITLAPPARTEKAGLKPETIPVGAQVTLHGHRNSDLKKFEMKTERVTYKGTLYNVYPDRE